MRAFADDIASTGPWDLVIGHSLGAAAATLAASNNPGWAQRLVLLEPAWKLAAEDRDAIRAREIADLGLTRDDLIGRPGYVERDVEAKLAGLEGVAEGAVAGVFDDNPVWDIRVAAAALNVPTLVIAGDPAVSTALAPADAEAVTGLNPLVSCQRIRGACHSPFRDAPEETRAALLSWINPPPSG
jgi:pimeloyl-ACP methyl ester carboxylesterase